MIKRKMILAQIKRIPHLPASTQEALSIMRDPDLNMGKLAETLKYDPSVTANILRLANSPYFGGVQRITSLQDAIVRLGAKQVTQLLLTVAVAPRIRPKIDGYDLPACALLEQSLAIAVASELVAAELKIEPPAYTFTAGLLANVGKTVLGQFLEVDGEAIVEKAEAENISFEEAERQVLGIDHLEAGAVLLAEWRLPEEIVEVVRHRLNPGVLGRVNPALDLVHVGDAIARMTGIGQGLDGLHYRVDETVVTRLNLDEAQIERVMQELIGHVDKLKNVLGACKS